MSQWDCSHCERAKRILDKYPNGQGIEEEEDYNNYRWAMDRKTQHTDIFCGSDCNNPPELPYANKIDLKDGIRTLLDRNPSKIIQSEIYKHYFLLCTMATNNLFPVLGGFYEQPTVFIEYYEEFIKYKDASNKIAQMRMSKES